MFPVIIIALIILGIEFIAGILANGLIIIVNFSEWIRNRKLTCCDVILTSLGISRFFLQCTIIINNILFQIPQGIDEWSYYLWTVIMSAYPSGHSIILILGNVKLKRVAVRVLHYAGCRLRDAVS
ncbi:taste receptor type 2 member 1-like [Gopherus evgoodei]|uniref:taste receptor type 2 member 1-like n=1 Tax=Gopherus evgoodei TaxID=1825980 RepID=UPI0011CF845B|nr:taste receptor type 2 member 1-like [Gopherus evgoodei]